VGICRIEQLSLSSTWAPLFDVGQVSATNHKCIRLLSSPTHLFPRRFLSFPPVMRHLKVYSHLQYIMDQPVSLRPG
jgi:hypothetical protein